MSIIIIDVLILNICVSNKEVKDELFIWADMEHRNMSRSGNYN